MPVVRWPLPLLSLAAAAMLASAPAASAHVQVGFGHSAAWGYFAALPYSYYGPSWAIAFPGHARTAGWPVAGFPFHDGLHGAAGRLHRR